MDAVALLNKGSIIGDKGLDLNIPRTATVVCLEDCSFAVMRQIDYVRIFKPISLSMFNSQREFFTNNVFKRDIPSNISGKLAYDFFKLKETRKQGEFIFKQGSKQEYVYVIESGKVLLFREEKIGRKTQDHQLMINTKNTDQTLSLHISILSKGDILGDDDYFMRPRVHFFNCLCIEGCKILKISNTCLNSHMKNYPELIHKIGYVASKKWEKRASSFETVFFQKLNQTLGQIEEQEYLAYQSKIRDMIDSRKLSKGTKRRIDHYISQIEDIRTKEQIPSIDVPGKVSHLNYGYTPNSILGRQLFQGLSYGTNIAQSLRVLNLSKGLQVRERKAQIELRNNHQTSAKKARITNAAVIKNKEKKIKNIIHSAKCSINMEDICSPKSKKKIVNYHLSAIFNSKVKKKKLVKSSDNFEAALMVMSQGLEKTLDIRNVLDNRKRQQSLLKSEEETHGLAWRKCHPYLVTNTSFHKRIQSGSMRSRSHPLII